MDRTTLATAYQTEHGIQATCPTTRETFIGPIVRTARFGGHDGVWLLCAVCDAFRHTHEECDPRAPQYHPFILHQEPAHV